MSNSTFKRGSGVYKCRCCDHNTRDTGGGGARVKLCDLCYDLAGEKNHVNDTGRTYESAANVAGILAALDNRDGAGTARRIFPAVCDAAKY